MDILGGNAVIEERVYGGDGFLRPRSNSKWVGFVGLGLDPVLQTVLQKELEEHAIELHSYARHFSLCLSLTCVFAETLEKAKMRNEKTV